MVEVFKTNVTNKKNANKIVSQLHKTFVGTKANFDLKDCDNILRMKYDKEFVCPTLVIELLKNFGFVAEVLPG